MFQSERTTRILIELKLNRDSVILFSFLQYIRFIRGDLKTLTTSIGCKPKVDGRVREKVKIINK